MITPVDIQNKEFKTALYGYKKEEIEEFMGIVASEFDMLYKQNIALTDKVNMLSDAVKQYKEMETALQNTIMTAQSVSEELKRTAQLNADNIIKEAENKAADMLIKAKNKADEIAKSMAQAKQNYEVYKTQIKTVVESQLKIINELN